MKATRKTIPTLIEERAEFTNDSGTLMGRTYPSRQMLRELREFSGLDEVETSRLRIDSEQNVISYIVLSYQTPIAWETADGHVYKVEQELTQTSEQHKGLLHLFFRR